MTTIDKNEKIMYNVNSNKQLTKNKQHRLGSHKKQLLLFSLAHLILC